MKEAKTPTDMAKMLNGSANLLKAMTAWSKECRAVEKLDDDNKKNAITIKSESSKEDKDDTPYLSDPYACKQLLTQFNKSEFSSRDKNIMPSEIELRCIPEYEPLADAIVEKHGGFKKFAEKCGFVYQP